MVSHPWLVWGCSSGAARLLSASHSWFRHQFPWTLKAHLPRCEPRLTATYDGQNVCHVEYDVHWTTICGDEWGSAFDGGPQIKPKAFGHATGAAPHFEETCY
jgi:hypothetical protein